jgi:DNA-binding winged helix-turn-helix (wHTH) protein/tetratricopeptide (TPR) repeat protein
VINCFALGSSAPRLARTWCRLRQIVGKVFKLVLSSSQKFSVTAMCSQVRRLYEFGPFRLDPQKRILLRGNDPVPLTLKALETLLVLVENRDHVLLKDDLMKMLWPDSFVEESNLSQNIFMLRRALGDSAQERRYILTVPGKGYQFTETVREIGEQEGKQEEKQEEETVVIGSRSLSRVVVEQQSPVPSWLWAALATLLVAGMAAGFLIYRTRHNSEPEKVTKGREFAPVIKVRPSVAVLGFRNLSRRPDKEWLSAALSEMLNTELAAGEQLRVVSGEQVTRANHDLPWGDTDTLAKDSLAGLRSNLDADYVTLGSYTVVGEGSKTLIRLDFRLQNAIAGETISEDAVSGNEADLFDLASEAGSRMRKRLGVNEVSSQESAQVRASLPSNPRAARLYTEGLAKLRVFEALAARDLLQQAVAAEPRFPGAHAALSSAWFQLGYEIQAKDEARRALDLSGNLSHEESLSIEAQYRELSHEWPKTIELYSALADLFPDDLDYGLRLAKAQDKADARREALKTLELYRKLPSPLGDDPRIDLAEGEVLNGLGEFKRAQEVAAAAGEKGKTRHARLVLAQARRTQGWALERLGNLDDASAGMAEAKVLFASAGDFRHSADTLLGSGNVSYAKGDYEEARRQFEEALLIYHKIGSEPASVRAIEDIGNAFYEEGKLDEAKTYYNRELHIAREVGDRWGVSSAQGNMANVLDGLGDLAGAQKMQEQALQFFQEVGDKRAMGSTEGNLGAVLEEQGDLAGAAQHYQQGLQLDREIGFREGQGYKLVDLANVLLDQDDLKSAREKAEQALTLRKELKENVLVATCLIQIARLSLEEGQSTDAENSASESVRQLKDAHAPELSASAYSVLALAQVANGKPADAQSSARFAASLAAKTSNRTTQFDAAIAGARVGAALGRFAEARKELAPVLSQASKFGYALYLFEARLTQGQIALKSGPVTTAIAQLTALEKDARAKGFLLIARKAATATAKRQN